MSDFCIDCDNCNKGGDEVVISAEKWTCRAAPFTDAVMGQPSERRCLDLRRDTGPKCSNFKKAEEESPFEWDANEEKL